MNKYAKVIYCLLLLFIYVTAEDNLNISIIVPCHVKHAGLLYDLLKIYTQQTVLPDEIVISISQAGSIDPHILERIRDVQWPFEVNILTSDRVQYPGVNRNVACSNAQGDIFILNDADDIPHPQRNEIIAYAFQHYACDHVAHRYLWLSDNASENAIVESFFKKYVVNQLSYVNPPDFQTAWNIPIHNGNIGISARVFLQIQWLSKKNAMDDTLFNAQVYNQFPDRIVVHVPLILYRNYLSTLVKDDSAIKFYEQHHANIYDQYKSMLQLNGFEVRDY